MGWLEAKASSYHIWLFPWAFFHQTAGTVCLGTERQQHELRYRDGRWKSAEFKDQLMAALVAEEAECLPEPLLFGSALNSSDRNVPQLATEADTGSHY